jgi:hypothetical protein
VHEREDAVLFHGPDSKNPAKEPVARHETDAEGELCDSPAIAARDTQQADGAPIVAQVPLTAAEQIPPVPCCEPDIPSAMLTGEALTGHNAFVQSRWEEFYGDDTEDNINGWPKSRHCWSKDLPTTYCWSYWHDPYDETRLTRQPKLFSDGYGSGSETTYDSLQPPVTYPPGSGPNDPNPWNTRRLCHRRQKANQKARERGQR